MRLKLYRATTVAQAMALVRAELGIEALILGTRRTAAGVEVTAALEREATPAPAHPADVLAQQEQRRTLDWHGAPAALAAQLATAPVEAALATTLCFAPLALGQHLPPLVLAGPPGAGKTLTVARLAARLVLAGQSPLVISADSQRAGAAEQLAAFTRVLGLTLIVAHDAMTLARALTRRIDGAPVLIDTAGIDPFAPAAQAGVAGLATAASGAVALVLPAGLDPAEATDTAAAFKAAGATALVATRLDLARRLGGILAAAAILPLAEAGVSADAATGLVPATPALLAARLSPPPVRRAA